MSDVEKNIGTHKPQFDGEWVRLGDVIKKAKSARCGSDSYPILSITMRDGIVEQASRFKKSIASRDTGNYKVVEPGQLVVGFPIDEGVIYVQNFNYPGIMSPAYDVWDIDSSRVDPSYLELALHSPQSMDYYRSNLRGTTARRRSLPTNTLCDLTFPLPSLENQRIVVKRMSMIATLLDNAGSRLSALDDLVKSRFVEMFGDPIEQPKYQTESLGEACTKIGSGATPRGGKTIYMDNGTPFIRSLNVHNGTFIRKNLAYIGEEEAKKLSNVSLKRGDVLLNITGASVARSCVLPDDLVGGRVNQHVAILRANQSVILPCILNATLTSESYQRFMLEGAQKAGATREAITKQDLERFRVSIPPLSLQQQFADFVAKVDKLGFDVQQQIEKLETLKQSLMQEYFG
ncbi:restriction endonuclease subunit S [Olsenella uli]|uniref:restriction endonuclease subunit S n=1 Tax=Olsenella uli TaxID=133926 RepID=UPI003D7BA302